MFYTNVPINQSNRVYLERPRVDRILEEAVKQPVVFVCAGVGYGKTQAVYSFLRKRRYIIVWIQFSGRDNIAARFWENITGAIGALHPDSARQLTEIGFPDTSRKFEYYLKIPQKEILPGSKYIFVYDNLQLIRDRKALRFLEQTITLPFPNITSILISRGEPQLNTEKLFFGQAPRITEDELRFTLEETAAFFELQRLKTGPETVALVYRDTEGWAFATYLAALALNRDSANYAESHRLIGVRSNIFKLIEKEIMEGMDPALRKFLIKLSLMDHFAPELLRDIQGEENPLERLESLGAFFQFDAYLNAYRIHPLFLEFLAGKQDELPAEEKRETYQKAAEWCIKNGQKIDAFIYLEKAEDYDRFFFAVHEAFPLIVPEPVARALLAICEKAPEAAYERNPGLYVLYTWMLITLRFFTRAKADLREIIGKLKTRKLSGINKWALRGCYINMGLCGYFTGAYMRDYSFTDNFDLASRYNDASISAARQPGFVAQVAFCACRVYSPEKGEFEKAIAVLDKMVPCLAGAYNGCAWGLDDLARSEFALLRGKLDEAEGHAQEALRKARERSQYEIEDRAMFFLLRIGLARGDGRTAGETFRLIEERPDTPGFGNQHILRDIVGGWFYVQTGRRGRVAAWLKSDFEESDLNSVLNGAETLIKARYHLAEKRFGAVLATLENQDDGYGAAGFLAGRIEIKALEAVCRYQMKDIEGAAEALMAARGLSLPNEIVMPFFELGSSMRALANAVRAKDGTEIDRKWLEKIRNGAAVYAKKLRIAVRIAEGRDRNAGNGEDKGGKSDGDNLLSRRETEVLTGLSRGLTRSEIAENTALSINTVKSIIKSVYTKLGAVNQADAVRIAAARGIFK